MTGDGEGQPKKRNGRAGNRRRVFTEGSVRDWLGEEFCARLTRKGSKWSPARWAAICHARWLGVGDMDAARGSGLNYQTVRLWRREHPELAQMYDSAAPQGVIDLTERLNCSNDPKDLRWRLERRSADFAPPVRRIEEKVAEPIEITFVGMDIPADAIPVPPKITGKGDDDEAPPDTEGEADDTPSLEITQEP